MAIGGGTFIAQNKILPGSYINFVAAGRASTALSERGIVAMPLKLSWGPEGEVFTVTKDEFMKNSTKIFGYAYTDKEMLELRELFKNARMGLFYRLGNGGQEAKNEFATAKYRGLCGNKISIVIDKNEEEKYTVKTKFDGNVVDEQKGIAAITDLAPNDFVNWKKTGWTLAPTITALRDGEDGTGKNYQDFLDKSESYSFHILALADADRTAAGLFEGHAKKMRDDRGVKFQTVLYDYPTANHEGIISVKNKLIGENGEDVGGEALIYWVAGAESACEVNKTLTNKTYDGELQINVKFTQDNLETAINNGEFVFHRVGDSARVLEDINTLTAPYEKEKSSDFSDNQVIRVLDQIGNDIAVLFNENYLGKTPNDEAGRVSLWSDIVSHHKQLEALRAIDNFDSAHVTVEQGEGKKSVVVTDIISPVCAMTKLYMTVIVE